MKKLSKSQNLRLLPPVFCFLVHVLYKKKPYDILLSQANAGNSLDLNAEYQRNVFQTLRHAQQACAERNEQHMSSHFLGLQFKN